MIIDYSTTYNTYFDTISNFNITIQYACPCCRAKHSMTRHGYYHRYLIVMGNAGLEEAELDILRLRCSSCGHTHAILPGDIIPFSLYTFPAILWIVSEHIVNKKSILSIAEDSHTSYQVIYRMLKLLLIFFDRIVLLLRAKSLWQLSCSPSLIQLIKIIVALSYDAFLSSYFFYYQKPFMLNRRSTSSYILTFGSHNF